jgi:hypothetical protein
MAKYYDITTGEVTEWHNYSPPPPDCPRCKEEIWFSMPDSLAIACRGCGFVFVLGDGWEVGASIQEWHV